MGLDILKQSNFTAGELDPKLRRRDNLKFYEYGLAKATNLIASPQGEIVNRPGLAYVGRVRSKLAEVSLSGATITAPNGGTVGNLAADDGVYFKTTNAIDATDPFQIWTVDFGTPKSISMVLIKNYAALPAGAANPSPVGADYPWTSEAAASATRSEVLRVQYQAGDGSFVDFGYPLDLGTVLRTRLVATPPGQPVTARVWRLVKVGTSTLAPNVYWQDYLQFLTETNVISAARIWRFSFDQEDNQFEVVATEGAAEVYKLGVRAASFPLPYTADQLLTVRRAQRLDTLLTFHPDVQPRRITRQGAYNQWDVRPATFTNIPLFDYDGTNAGAVNEKQDINFKNYIDGDTFTLTYEGEESASITYITTSATTMAANIQAALEDLAGIGLGNVSVSAPATNVYRAEFINLLGGASVSNLAPQTKVSANGIAYMSIFVRGKQGGEAAFSTARGWPRSGCFYGSRLFLGGLKLRPQTILASRQGDYFNFNTAGGKSDSGIDVDIDSDTVVTIQTLFPSTTLQIFTSSAEFYFAKGAINAPAPNIERAASKRGLKAGTPVFEIDAGAVFAAASGDMLCNMSFTYEIDNYTAPPIAVQAAHLTTGIVDIGTVRAKSTGVPDLALIVRDDGGAAFMSALLSQDVLGCFNVITDGSILAATGDANGDMYVIVNRQRPTGDILTLEKFDSARMLDASILLAGVYTNVTGLDHLEGRTVWLYIDGGAAGQAVVTGGQVTLPRASKRTVEVGLWTPPLGQTLPGVLQEEPGRPNKAASLTNRTGDIEFDLGPTSLLKAGIPGKQMWIVPLAREALLDVGPGENLYDGWARLTGLTGFTADAQVEFTQDQPGPLCIRQIIATVSS